VTILHIDSSINGDGSASRELSHSIVDQVRQSKWGQEVV
jgi:FMN-dependent NADH-azoreductase